MTSDMPRAWPFFEGGMFLAVVMLFPAGLVGLWQQFERDILGGARLPWVLAGPALGLLGLIAYRCGWMWWLPDYGWWALGGMVDGSHTCRPESCDSGCFIHCPFLRLRGPWPGSGVSPNPVVRVVGQVLSTVRRLGGAALVARLRLVPAYVRRFQWA